MILSSYNFGQIKIDDKVYQEDVVVDRGVISFRDSRESEKYKTSWHTPLSIAEYIPWDCKTLYIGTGASGTMEVLPEVIEEAKKRNVELVIDTTPNLVLKLAKGLSKEANAILHLTC